MTNNDKSNNPTDNPDSQPSSQPPVPTTPPAPTQHEVRGDANERTQNQNDTARELAREFRWVEFAQLIVNGVLAIIGIVALCIYYGQLEIMRGQLGEIIKQYPELQKSADASKSAADISAKQLKMFEQQMTLEQRAWIGLIGIDGEPVLDKPFFVHGMFRNTGKSPALHVTFIAAVEGVKRGELPDIEGESKQESQGSGVVAPGAELHFTGSPLVGPEAPIMRKELFDQWKSGQFRICAHGIIKYWDIFGVKHWVTFCQMLKPTGRYGPCPYHNDIDKN